MVSTAVFTWVLSVSPDVVSQAITVDGVTTQLSATENTFSQVMTTVGSHTASLTCSNAFGASSPVTCSFSTVDTTPPASQTGFGVTVNVA